jgi:hypothetical protein
MEVYDLGILNDYTYFVYMGDVLPGEVLNLTDLFSNCVLIYIDNKDENSILFVSSADNTIPRCPTDLSEYPEYNEGKKLIGSHGGLFKIVDRYEPPPYPTKLNITNKYLME